MPGDGRKRHGLVLDDFEDLHGFEIDQGNDAFDRLPIADIGNAVADVAQPLGEPLAWIALIAISTHRPGVDDRLIEFRDTAPE